jgi:hypothetical protein
MVRAVIGITIEYRLHEKVTQRLSEQKPKKGFSTLITELLEKWLVQEGKDGTKARQK